MKKTIILIILMVIAGNTFSQSEQKLIRKGNKYYNEQDYTNAEISYQKAMEIAPDEYRIRKNHASAAYKSENYETASKSFTEHTIASRNEKEESSAFYNLGNSLLQSGDFPKSIAAYKSSLIKDPSNNNARYNLQIAQYLLNKQQQQQQQQQGGGDQNQDNKEQNQQEQQQDQQNQDNQDQQDQQQQQNEEQKISKEDAERMLKALENEEKDLQEEVKKEKARKARKVKIEKEW